MHGTLKIDKVTGKTTLRRSGNVQSLLPNPTNGVILNKTMIFSDSENSTFNKYLSKEMKKRKIKPRFVKTYEFSHIREGNLHCSSHTIPYCKPREEIKRKDDL